MFITLNSNKENISVEQASASTAQGTRPRHTACTQCRVKKLKCSGDKDRCTSCASNDWECIYPPPSKNKNTSGKRTRPSSHPRSPITQPSPPPSMTGSPLKPQHSVSSSSGSVELDPDQFSWIGDTTSSDTAGSLLDPFWKESPASLEDLLGETANSVLPDLGETSDWFLDQGCASSCEAIRQSNGDDALSALSSEIFGDQFANPLQQHAKPSDLFIPSLNDVEPISFPDFIGTPLNTGSDGHCRCMTDALVILDKLEAQKTEKTHCVAHTMSGILSINKSALSQCTRVLECSACQCRPGCALLLILICRNLVSQFQQLLSDEFRPLGNKYPSSNSLRGRASSLGQYSIDTSEEQVQLLYALAILRGRSLALFLSKLKKFVSFQSVAGHREKIEATELWHKSLMADLKKMTHERIYTI